MKSTTRLLGGLHETMDFQPSGNCESPEKDEQAHPWRPGWGGGRACLSPQPSPLPQAPEPQVASDLLSATEPCLWGLS